MTSMISASIVTYKTKPVILLRTINSYLEATHQSKLYVIDNSPTDSLRSICIHPLVEYMFMSTNVGYGTAHNIALRKAIETSRYHLVLNPDVFFASNVIAELLEFMEENSDVGLTMPKVLYPDGRPQQLRKLLPLPHNLMVRRFFPWFKKIQQRLDYFYEMQFVGSDSIIEAPFLSGCFMMLRTQALKQIGFFDERFFLYFEDTDLSRRIHEHYKTMYFPKAKVYHIHERGMYKDIRLLANGIKSAVQYFNKWGWVVDEKRDTVNKKILQQYTSVYQTKSTIGSMVIPETDGYR